MTSKNLFFKRMKQDLEQRVWLPIVFFILSFVVMEMSLFSQLDRWQDRVDFVKLMDNYLMNTFFAPDNGFTIVTIGMAFVTALTGFTYIHSAKKLDVYHSIPIKRERLFIQQYVYGVLYYIVPMVLHVLICVGICASRGLATGEVISQALGFVLIQIAMFLPCYAVTCVAVTLTGNLVISVLGSGVLACFSLIVVTLKESLMDRFYATHYYTGYEQFPAFSPIHLIVEIASDMNGSNRDYLVYTEHVDCFVKCILMALVYTVIAVLLYKKRPTEAAGGTMAFAITEPIVKTMLVVPLSIVSGFFFSDILMNGNDFWWFVLGCAFAFVLGCPLVEIIFRKDVKAVLKHPLQMVFNGGCIAAIILVLQFDLFGYDSYLPDADEVESYCLNLSEFTIIHGSGISYDRNEMAITDNEGLRKLLEHAVEHTCFVRKDYLNGSLFSGYDKYEGMVNSNFRVTYRLKNGKEVHRSYLVNIMDEQVQQWIGEMYNDMEYKLGAYPILSESNDVNFTGIQVEGAYTEVAIPLSEAQMQEFVETYRRELWALKFDEVLKEYPIANLSFLGNSAEEDTAVVVYESNSAYYAPAETYSSVQVVNGNTFNYDTQVYGYMIYPSFTETRALLKEYGIDIEAYPAVEDIISVQVQDSSAEADDHDGYLTKLMVADYTNADTEKLEQILPILISNKVRGDFRSCKDVEEYISVRVRYYQNRQELSCHCTVAVGTLPEFVYEDMKPADY